MSAESAIGLLTETCAKAASVGASALTEPELYAILAAAGLRVPRHEVLRADGSSRTTLAGEIVLKIVSREILHKTDVGGVRFCRAEELSQPFVEAFARETARRWSEAHQRPCSIDGVLAVERVAFDRARLAGELIVGLRHSADFGFVGMIGLGGVKAELFGSRLPRREAAALFDPTDPERAFHELRATLAHRDLSGALRGSERVLSDDQWRALLAFLGAVAKAMNPVGHEPGLGLEELELNPMVVSDGALMALDGLARLTPRRPPLRRPPAHKLRHLFEPRTVAIAGVSSKSVNMGRIILRNLLRDGFSPGQLTVLKPGDKEIDGVRCAASPASMEPVDLAVLAVSAGTAPDVLEGLVRHQKAEAVIVIPGGMAEKEGGAEKQHLLERTLLDSRSTTWRGPVVCGPNSMGVRSLPGCLDTTFIPSHKLSARSGPLKNLALISQSGAFTITRESHLEQLTPRYLVSAGNQADLGVADYVGHVLQDPKVQVVAVYLEGFRAGDGRRLLQSARAAKALGKQLVLYKGGRTPEGQGTAAGHTAAIAGDYRAAWHLLTAAGVLVAESFSEFEGLVRVSCALAGRTRGQRIMAMSNAGFEAVGIADHLESETHRLELAKLSDATRAAVGAALKEAGIDGLVDVKNPLDVTPSATDQTHLAIARAVLEDDSVDALILGVVPMSPAVATLGSSPDPSETIEATTSLAKTLPELFKATKKPIVAVVDAGRLYDPLVTALEQGGVPVFRRADEATHALGRWVCVP